MSDIDKLHQELDEIKSTISGQQKQQGKDIWDKLSSITPLLTGVLIAGLGTLATFIYNNRQMDIQHQEKMYEDNRADSASRDQQKLQRIDALDKNVQYLISKDPRERQLGYFNFSALGYESEALQIIAMNKDSIGGYNVAVNIEKTSKNKNIRNQANETIQTLTTSRQIVALQSQLKFGSGKQLGFDISHESVFPDSNTIVKSKIKFVFIKATQGGNFVDPQCLNNISLAKRYHLSYSLYHFFIWNSDVAKQASNFISIYNKSKATMPPCVDLEDQPGIAATGFVPIIKANFADSALKFISLLQAAKHVDIIVYTYASFAKEYLDPRFGRFKLFLGNYSNDYDPNTGIPDIWSKADYWQFNSMGLDLIVANR